MFFLTGMGLFTRDPETTLGDIFPFPTIFLAGEEFRNLENTLDLKTRRILYLKPAQTFVVSKKPDKTGDSPDLVTKKRRSGGEQRTECIHSRTHVALLLCTFREAARFSGSTPTCY